MSDLEAQLRAYGAVLDGAGPAVTDVVEAVARRVRRSFVVAAAAAIVVAVIASAVAVTAARSGDANHPHIVTPAPTDATTTPTSVRARPEGPVLAIGDSVMEGAKGALEAALPGVTVDAVKSRQMLHAVPLIDEYDALGKHFGTLVIHLGTNGLTSAGALDAVMRAAGRREVFFVTVRVPRVWAAPDNVLFRALPSRWPNAHVIDWEKDAHAHGDGFVAGEDWFVADGFHLTASGQRAYSSLIAAQVRHASRAP